MRSPFTNVYGLARTLIALSSLLTLGLSDADALFRPLQLSSIEAGPREGPGRFGLFALCFPHLELGRWIAIAALAVVASGWRPRVTGVLHWWVTASTFGSLIAQDGGDQCAAVLTLLLVPVTLCDPRAWHWADAPLAASTPLAIVRNRIGSVALALVRAQVALLYLHAAVGKAAVKEWIDGTALYYWMLDTRVGVPSAYHDHVRALLAPDWVVPLVTWSPVALEYGLFLSLAMSAQNPARRYLFAAAVLFHAGTIVMFGLVSFAIVMCGAVVLLLRPVSHAYSWSWLAAAFAAGAQAWKRAAQLVPELSARSWRRSS